MFTSDMHRADLVRSFGPDRVMATAPIGAVSNMTSTAIVKIWKKKIPHLDLGIIDGTRPNVSKILNGNVFQMLVQINRSN